MTTTINIADVRVDGGTQSRAAINRDAVAEYMEAIEGGALFPPITVFYDGAAYWLADGFHRYEAFSRAKVYEVAADVRQGTQRDAILFSVGANDTHGLRRTNDDKRRAVLTLLNDAEWSQWSNREIARACGVSEYLARDTRGICDKNADSPVRTVQRNGTTYQQNTAKIGKVAKPAAAEPTPDEPQPQLPPDDQEVAPSAAEPEPDAADVKERRAVSRMNPDAMVDEIIGLRADLVEAKAKAAALKVERDDLAAKLKEATSSDMGRALGNAQRRADTATGRMNEYMTQAKRLEYRLKKAEARVKELEDMEVVPA